jgi:hypothetical protein
MAAAHPTTITVTHADLVKFGGVIFATVVVPFALYLLQNAYQNYRSRLDRRRQLYAEAFSACMEYKEFVFVIYRRGKSDPEAERLRISEALRDVQKRMGYHQAWLETESDKVAEAYDMLVRRLRNVAGSEMKAMWRNPPITKDEQMIIEKPIDWKDLGEFEKRYIKTVKRELTPWWVFWQRFHNNK